MISWDEEGSYVCPDDGVPGYDRGVVFEPGPEHSVQQDGSLRADRYGQHSRRSQERTVNFAEDADSRRR